VLTNDKVTYQDCFCSSSPASHNHGDCW